MIRTYQAGTRADDPGTPAARGLKAALARNAKQKAEKERASAAAPAAAAPIAPAKPNAKTWHPPKTEAEKARFAAANGRVLAVMAHPAFAGHSKIAAKLLSNPKLSAAEIGNLLDVAAANTPAKQESALAEMQAVLAEQKALNAGAPVQPRGSTGSAAIWDKAIAKVNAEFKAGGAA